MPSDLILRRLCRIAPYEGLGDVELSIEFERPRRVEDVVIADVTLSSHHFTKVFSMHGEDDLQALASAMFLARTYLEGKMRDGYPIYMYEPGDIAWRDFWRSPTRFPPRIGGVWNGIRRSPLAGAKADLGRLR